MNILVTGGGGFIGSHLCRDLLRAGHRVAALSRDPAPWRLADELGSITLISGHLERQDEWAEKLKTFNPHAVAHLAWTGVANFDRDDPGQAKNIQWTVDLLSLAREAGARTFLGLGSHAEYGPKSEIVGPEDATAPTTVYGEAKLAAGRIAARLAAASGMRFVWMRVFSTFGPMDHPYWMIPSLICSLLREERPALTAADQHWDFLHVADAARAIRMAVECDSARGVYALGSGDAPRLRATIEWIRDSINPRLPLGFGEIPYRPDQVMHLQADITRLKRDLGWTPSIDVQQGLVETIAWYRKNAGIVAKDGK
jgi:UDP-glucose 4-epimerase